jgi:hypothetical protein
MIKQIGNGWQAFGIQCIDGQASSQKIADGLQVGALDSVVQGLRVLV